MEFLKKYLDYYSEYFSYSLLGNTVFDYLIAFLFFLALYIAFKLFKSVVLARLNILAKKTETDFDDEIIKILENISPFFYFVLAVYFPLMMLNIGDVFERWVFVVLVIVLIYQVVHVVQNVLSFALESWASKVDGKRERAVKTTFQGIRIVVGIVVWVVGALLILSNLGVNVTSLVASLGIGGIAIALAAQNVLSDMFSSFSIYLDKPFVVGDFIVIGADSGTVKKIGIKTTRIESLQGEEIVVSNKELTTVRVQNFKKLKKRRILMNIGIVYDTDLKKMKRVNFLIEEAVKAVKMAEFARSHFSKFGDFSLIFEVVYYVLSPEYSDYMDVNQTIGFAIKESFEKKKIQMAFPTQTIHIEK